MSSDPIILDQDELDRSRDSPHGTFPHQRNIRDYIEKGFIILDKYAGPTSHEVVATVKKILEIEKAGHSGTLDPQVTGVLPIALQHGTKVLSVLVGARKRYIANMHLAKKVPEKSLDMILNQFEDRIYQFPPLKSNVAMKLRKRTIFELKKLDAKSNEILLDIYCEAGTYIRTLCIDIGRGLGTPGHMKELRRVQSGPFHENRSVTMHELFDAYQDYKEDFGETKIRELIKPIEMITAYIPRIVLKENAIDPICHGAQLMVPGIASYTDFEVNQQVALMSSKGELIAIATTKQSSEYLEDTRTGKIAAPNRVIMDRGTYPKYKK